MKGFISLIISLAVITAIASGVWYFVDGTTPQEQLDYLKATVSQGAGTGSEKASNTAESASKLGKVLKANFDEAQDVYQNGAEAKYDNY